VCYERSNKCHLCAVRLVSGLVGRIASADAKRSASVSKRASGCQTPSCRVVSNTKGLAAQFVEQRLSLFQIGGVEAFREPAVDFGEYYAPFLAAALLREQPCEAGGRTQFQ
jgi:hypothetical protein